MPVIRTQEQVSKLENGQVLEVICTDPGALFDIPAWCRIHGHKVLATNSSAEESTIQLQICSDPR